MVHDVAEQPRIIKHTKREEEGGKINIHRATVHRYIKIIVKPLSL